MLDFPFTQCCAQGALQSSTAGPLLMLLLLLLDLGFC